MSVVVLDLYNEALKNGVVYIRHRTAPLHIADAAAEGLRRQRRNLIRGMWCRMAERVLYDQLQYSKHFAFLYASMGEATLEGPA